MLKYDGKMFGRVLKAFALLPLATLVQNKVFITHGGLFREPNITIDEIRK